jgi:hypothetical protein
MAASMLYAGAAQKLRSMGNTAAKDTVHATAKTGEDIAHGTPKQLIRRRTLRVMRPRNRIRHKKGAHGIGHGVKKGATKTADALK